MKERVLKWLDISEMKILKHIIITIDRLWKTLKTTKINLWG